MKVELDEYGKEVIYVPDDTGDILVSRSQKGDELYLGNYRLNQGEVQELVRFLQSWLKTGWLCPEE